MEVADGDGGEGIAVAMELRNHGVTELRKQAAWLRINGFTNQRTHKVRNYQVEKEYRTEYSAENNRATKVIESPYFSVRVTEVDGVFRRNLIKYDSFIIAMCLKGDCRIKICSTGDETVLKEGFSCLIPAAIADYEVIPKKGRTKLLETYIDNMDRSLIHKVSRFLHISER